MSMDKIMGDIEEEMMNFEFIDPEDIYGAFYGACMELFPLLSDDCIDDCDINSWNEYEGIHKIGLNFELDYCADFEDEIKEKYPERLI